ncbi:MULTISPECIES: putative diaminopimelate decarboxylase [Kitasatospora]|uniref:Putative diaminopimelate decarboxylase n=1 Tax=Kitasatospora setae (strain ATCC 33774 / DSM 43861 / JCM 3304 / KCC A-0304 / NBRC 14216 / KM-6054) TaxID=452652 RepID=E4N8H8_KITSK|nr:MULTISPECIES: putative diaminopimelate decarboxylase [Kitasatospora]BAJ27509.1 putative diaminopimelate decarboxylase [Kitasatospora setae KM-6054]
MTARVPAPAASTPPATAPAATTPEEAATAYGTPLYLYDLDVVAAAHADLVAALPEGAVIHYSLKANPHTEVAGTLAALGCRAEVSSTGELDAALAAGFHPADVTYSGPAKTAAEIATALRAGVTRFSVESVRDLEVLEELADLADPAESAESAGPGDPAGPGGVIECLLRINADRPVPGMGLAMAGVSTKFGVDFARVLATPEAFRDRGRVRITGLHLYMGTNLPTEDVLLGQFEAGLAMCGELAAALGRDFAELDLGGGFGTPYAGPGERPAYPGLRAGLEKLLDLHVPTWRTGGPAVSFESGRYLVGSCGTLVTTVVDVKESKGQRYALVDSGIHHLGGLAGLRRLPPLRPGLLRLSGGGDPAVGREAGPDAGPVTVAGPLCTPLDQWGSSSDLPPLRAGDLLAVPNTGAYGLTASLVGFLGYPAPVEVVTGSGRPTTATRAVLTRVPVERTPHHDHA